MPPELIAILIGLAAGALGGMFGIGGGLIMVPAMVAFLQFSQHKAQGTSLAVLMVPVAIAAVINYHRQGNVDIRTATFIALAFAVGGFFGSKMSLGLDDATLKKAFAIFLVIVAGYTWFKAESQSKKNAPPAQNVEAAQGS